MKYERKFLLECLPLNIEKFEKTDIQQFYLCYDPELKVVKKNNKYFIVKTIITESINKKQKLEIDEKFYDFLTFNLENKICKRRYSIPLSARITASVDVFHENLEGLKTVKVLFDSIEEASNFEVPNWFKNEITNEKIYKNVSLSKMKYYTKRKK